MSNHEYLMSLATGADRAVLAQILREALLHDAGCAVAILDAKGRVQECNDAFAQVFGEASPMAVEGTLLDSRLGKSAADTHSQAVRQAFDQAEPLVVDGVFGSQFVRATYRPMGTESSENPDQLQILLVIAPWDPETPPPPGTRLVRTRTDHSSPLSALTTREREILRHIGMGLPTAEIAKKLHRSVKTIEGHRVSLGIKLGVSNRVQLARIAIRSGLAPLSASVVETKPGDST